MNEKIYNHYIPQFLMKNFSLNGKSIGLYIKESKRYTEKASIKKICGKDYLYGKTSKLEDLLCEIEGEWAKIIKKICNSEKLPSNENEKKLLYAFFTISESRTLYIAEQIEKDFNDVLKNDVKYARYLKLNQYEAINMDDTKIKLNIPNLIPILCAAKLVESIYDELALVLVVNKTNVSYILSDYPITKYNPYLLDTANGYGWKQKGILAFAPISPNCMLALIDEKSYKLRSLWSKKVVIKNKATILELNKLMALQADKFLLFDNKVSKDYIELITSEKLKDSITDTSKLCITHFHAKSVKNKITLPFLKQRHKR